MVTEKLHAKTEATTRAEKGQDSLQVILTNDVIVLFIFI